MIEPIFFSDPYVGPEVVMADFKEVYLSSGKEGVLDDSSTSSRPEGLIVMKAKLDERGRIVDILRRHVGDADLLDAIIKEVVR